MGSLHCHQLSWLISWWEGGWTVKSCLIEVLTPPHHKWRIVLYVGYHNDCSGNYKCNMNKCAQMWMFTWRSRHEVASSDSAKSEKLQEGRHRDHFPFVFISSWRGKMSIDDRLKMKSLLSHDTCFSFTHSDVDLNVVEFRIHPSR